MRIKEIAKVRIRYGCQRIFTLLCREGWRDNHKRVHRLYCLEGLNLRTNRKKCSRAGSHRLARPIVQSINQCWSMDFVCDNLFDGKRFRALTTVENFSRKCHAIHVGQSIKGQEVVKVIERIRYNTTMLPPRIQVDNGTEFISRDFDRWAYENKVTLDYSRPGKPTDNPYIESFNGSLRDECLNVNWFLSLEYTCNKIKNLQQESNSFRPHSSLEGMTPDLIQDRSMLKA